MSNDLDDSPRKEGLDGDKVESDFNRTVVLPGPAAGATGGRGSGHRPSVPKRRKELDDIVRGVNVNPYINLELDSSPELESTLDTVEARYCRLSAFAQGGTATLSIARDRNLKRLVAVKSLKMDSPDIAELLEAFVTEAKVTAQLDHPGVIPIYGLSRDADNGIHLVMKLINGKTLREYLRNTVLNYRIRGIDSFDENYQLRKRLEIFLRVCDTMVYAHHRGVIHRDLKPENIMIGEFMEVFVMDWGLARVLPKGMDSPVIEKKVSGTPRYFPPEVLAREPLDFRSDIYTLGLILQEIVTLQYAITGNNEKEIIEHGRKAIMEPIEHQFKWKIDKALQGIIRKATDCKLEERYQTAEALAEDVRRYMAGLPSSEEKESLLDRLLRFFFERILKVKVGGAATADLRGRG
ncbi:MAG: serine/threonine protein kinase, partial [Victivallales bacterium]|nr:serine/threonine protein kinase [Victivallales bacterium]